MPEHFGLDNDNLPADAFPIQYKMIARAQNNKDKNLIKLLKSNTPSFHIKAFCGGGKKRELICHNKIIILSSLQRRVVEWYHTALYHPVERPGWNKLSDNILLGKIYAKM